MRFQVILSIFSILVSMGLMVVIVGQYHMVVMLNKGIEDLQLQSMGLDNTRVNEELFKGTLETLLDQGTKTVGELEGALSSDTVAKKKTETDTCQAEMKTIADELTNKEKEHADTEAKLKTESDAWTQEINTLKAQLTEFRPICHHVKKTPDVLKLCGNNST